MTSLLEKAFEAARTMPPEMQDDLAQVILGMTGSQPAPIQLTPEEEASFDESFAQAERDEFATDEELRAIRVKHGL